MQTGQFGLAAKARPWRAFIALASFLFIALLLVPAAEAQSQRTVRLVSICRTETTSQWRLDNLTDVDQTVTLSAVSGGFSETTTVAANTQKFVTSSVGGLTGPLTHRLTQSGAQIDVKAANNNICEPPPPPNEPANLAPDIKNATRFVIGAVVPQTTKTVTDMINLRFLGLGGGAPIFSGRGGNAQFRLQLADIARLSQGQQQAQADGKDGKGPLITSKELLYTGRFNVWVHGKITTLDDSSDGASFDGNVWNILGGADYRVTDNIMVGIATGYERYNLDTNYNNGSFDGHGYTVGPYIGLMFNRNIVLDAWAGATFLSYDVTGSGVSGDFDSTRYFVSVNLTGTWRWKGLRLAPRLSMFYAHEVQDAFVDSAGTRVAAQTVRLGRFSFGPEIGYTINLPGNRLVIEPFVSLRGEYDFTREGNVVLGNGAVATDSALGATVGFGIDFQWRKSVWLRLGGSYNAIGRGDLESWSGEARLQIRF